MGASKGRKPWNYVETEEIIKYISENSKYELIERKDKDNLVLKCDKGHIYNAPFGRFKRGHRCPYCVGKALYEPDYIKSVEESGFKFIKLDTKHNRIYFICDKGHDALITIGNWKQGSRCPYCSGHYTWYDDMKKNIENKGFKLITSKEEFENSRTILKIQCKNGHTFDYCYKGKKNKEIICKECEEMEKYNEWKRKLRDEGYEFLTSYEDFQKRTLIKNSSFNFKCKNNHIGSMCYSHWYNGQRCGRCFQLSTSSRAEKEIKEFLEELGFKVQSNDRTIIKPKELDLVIENKKIAIEYDGIYFHSTACETMGKKINKYIHLNKTEDCEKNGYQLIHIFENEWKLKNEIVKNRLKHLLGKSERNLYARNCTIKEVEPKIVKEFLNKYHIQGFVGSKIKLGAYYNDELVALMTFSLPSIAKGMNKEEGVWELSRFCTSCNIVGIASKLLKYFENNYLWSKIISFADRRWSQGKMYEKLGFTFEKNTFPNYYYYKSNESGNFKLYHRFMFRRDQLSEEKGSEAEIMKARGYSRIWDCGSKKYVKLNKS